MGNTALKNTDIKDAGRQDSFWVFPEELVVVEKREANLYDKRIEKPLKEEMVISIMEAGVDMPIIVRKDGRAVVVVDGKQRRAHAIEANKRLVAEGRQPRRVLVVLCAEKTDVAYFEKMHRANSCRQDDDVVTNAENVLFYKNRFGKTDEDAAKTWGKTIGTIRSWLRLMELTDAVRDAVREDKLSASDAVKNLADVPRDEQDKALAAYLASAPTTRKGKRNRDGQPAKAVSPISRLRTVFRSEDAMGALDKKTRTFVEFIYGKATMGDLMAAMPDVAEAIAKAGEKKTKAKKTQDEKPAMAAKGGSKVAFMPPRVASAHR